MSADVKYGANLPFSHYEDSEADHTSLLYGPQRIYKRLRGGSPPKVLFDHPSHNTCINQLQIWMLQV